MTRFRLLWRRVYGGSGGCGRRRDDPAITVATGRAYTGLLCSVPHLPTSAGGPMANLPVVKTGQKRNAAKAGLGRCCREQERGVLSVSRSCFPLVGLARLQATRKRYFLTIFSCMAVSLNGPPPSSTCNQPPKHGLTLWDKSPSEGVPLPLPISSEASGASDETLISPLIGNCAAVVTRAAAKPSISIRSIFA